MSKRPVIDTVLFDVGETLLEFGAGERHYFPAALRAGYDFLAEQGYQLPPFPRYARRLRRQLAARLIWSRYITHRELRPVPAIQAGHRSMGLALGDAAAAELAQRYYAALGVERRAAAGARAALAELQAAGLRLGIVSNSFAPPGGLDRHLDAEGLLDFFPVRIYSCEVGYMKPHRRIFELALERLGASAAGALYVGDKESIDVRGAARAGLSTVLKLVAGQPGPRRWRPDFVIRELEELPAIVRDCAADVVTRAPARFVRI